MAEFGAVSLFHVLWSQAGENVTYGAYGSSFLDKPVFLGSVAKNNSGDWINESGNIRKTVALGDIPATGDELLPNPSFDIDIGSWQLYCNSTASATKNRNTTTYDSFLAPCRIDCTINGDPP